MQSTSRPLNLVIGSRSAFIVCRAVAAAVILLSLVESARAEIIVAGINTSSPGSSGDPADWGAGKTVIIASGTAGTFGTLDVTDGSSLYVNSLILGFSGSASVNVSGGTVTTTAGSGLVVGNSVSGRSRLLITNGGLVSSPAATIGWSAADCGVTVTGSGSQWLNTGNLRLGNNPSASGNALTIADGGLVKVGGSLTVGGGTNNFLRLDRGFFALLNDQTSTVSNFITGGKVQTLSGTDWTVNTTPANFSLGYYATDEAAQAVTGYGGLGGYTILTTAAVPEPTTSCMALTGLACGGYTMWRRRRRA